MSSFLLGEMQRQETYKFKYLNNFLVSKIRLVNGLMLT